MTAIEVLREEVKEYIDHANDRVLRMVKAVLEIRQEKDDNIKEGKTSARKEVKKSPK